MSPDARPSGINLRALLLASGLMLLVAGLLGSGVVRMMRMLGFFPPERPPVEVSYEPYDDGKRLEDLLGPEERPATLPVWEVEEEDPSTATPRPSLEPDGAQPSNTAPPPPRPEGPGPD